jgi:hypothetical protein
VRYLFSEATAAAKVLKHPSSSGPRALRKPGMLVKGMETHMPSIMAEITCAVAHINWGLLSTMLMLASG